MRAQTIPYFEVHAFTPRCFAGNPAGVCLLEKEWLPDAQMQAIAAENNLAETAFVIARAEAGERGVPAWIEVIPNQMRVLVHSLPVRQQIESQLQEQLIVELYSK